MREILEITVNEEYASLLFRPDEGVRHGDSVRDIDLPKEDPRFNEVGKLQAKLRDTDGQPFFFGCRTRRQYSSQELEAAELFHLHIRSIVEPPGEECGTVYDESTACKHCGAGRKQTTPLILDLRKIPRNKDIIGTIADEWIVSQRLAELMVDSGITGVELKPVRHKALYDQEPVDLKKTASGRELLHRAERAGTPEPTGEFWVWLNREEQAELLEQARMEHAALLKLQSRARWSPLPTWYQLVVISRPVSVQPPTEFGVNPFDKDEKGEHRCPFGHVSGLNLLSEVFVSRSTWDGSDVSCTKEMVGCRRGLLVPRPLLLISQKFRQLLSGAKIKAFDLEVAHLR